MHLLAILTSVLREQVQAAFENVFKYLGYSLLKHTEFIKS